jgi:aspartate kinase
MEKIIEGITVKTDLAKVLITSVPDIPGSASTLFSNLGEAGFNIETITQNSTAKNFCDITFTIKESETEEVVDYIRNKLEDFQTTEIITNKNIALITIYGEKIAKTPGVAGKIFSTVAELKINIENITAGMTMISFVVPKDKSDDVVKAIKARFEM